MFSQTRTPDKESCSNVKVIKVVEQQQSPNQKPVITGIVRDSNGAVVPGVAITLIDTATKEKLATTTTDTGEFRFTDLKNGEYTIEIFSAGFVSLMLTQVLKAGESLRLESTLEPLVTLSTTVSSGIMTMPIAIPIEKPIYTNGTMTLSGDLIRRLPH